MYCVILLSMQIYLGLANSKAGQREIEFLTSLHLQSSTQHQLKIYLNRSYDSKREITNNEPLSYIKPVVTFKIVIIIFSKNM